jgi:hypothetical protein
MTSCAGYLLHPSFFFGGGDFEIKTSKDAATDYTRSCSLENKDNDLTNKELVT